MVCECKKFVQFIRCCQKTEHFFVALSKQRCCAIMSRHTYREEEYNENCCHDCQCLPCHHLCRCGERGGHAGYENRQPHYVHGCQTHHCRFGSGVACPDFHTGRSG